MLLALLIWVCASLAFALALAGAAARPLPSAAEQVTLAAERPSMPLPAARDVDPQTAVPTRDTTLAAPALAGLDT